ncbi:unnamed protein product [Orchesella dallaii]|uniref:L-ascorbate oxidase n=1 Tax=Orchesella dallaii TaxID=48710 RepID=A0ABP1QLD7_9HEXA
MILGVISSLPSLFTQADILKHHIINSSGKLEKMQLTSKVSLHSLQVLVALASISLPVHSKTVRHTFEISYISGNPDGVWTNSILCINGKFPGPTIEAEVGDVLEVTVINNIHDGQNVTIHWHGLHQRGTPFEDGPSQITQCPLKHGSTQVYTFPLLQTGTYWYHSHVNSQYTEGLWGSLIIRGTPEIWQAHYDEEILITLNDWYHTSAEENEHWFLRPESFGAPPFPFSVLMNGVGRYPCDYGILQGRYCDPYSQKRPVFKVQHGKTYRIRLINVSGWVAFNFTISGHVLNPIEVDGVDLAPNQPSHNAVYIGAGQRYSFLVRADVGVNGDEFLIRANLRREFLFTRPGNINPYPEALMDEVTGVIQYSDSEPVKARDSLLLQPTFESFDYSRTYQPGESWSILHFLPEMNLRPYDGAPAPEYFNTQVALQITFENDAAGIRRGSFNGKPFHLTMGKPILGKYVDGTGIPEDAFPIYIHYGSVVQVIVNNPEAGPHPLHLHGHYFWVVGMGQSGEGSYDPTRHQLNLGGFKRDTVLIKERSWLVIRFLADNPGVWTLHCHIDWHNLSGMAMTFVEAPEMASSISAPLEAKKVCADHNVLVALALLSLPVHSKTVKHTFEVSYFSGLPDGVWVNNILCINGKFPGPTIEAEVGDVLEVTVINKIQDGQNVTIHWHGLHQRGTQFQDGPSQITQCPLKHGSTQVYTFPLLQPGTFWYHSHVNSQYTEGLWGSMIVRGTPEIWQELYDEELLITLNDWYHSTAKENEEWFMSAKSGGAPPFPSSVLMNGVGRYPCGYSILQRRLCSPYSQKRPVFKVQPGKTYRLRLINVSGWVAFNFTVSGHILTPIEVDSVDLAANQAPHHAVYIGAGQRYSFLLRADAGVEGDEFLIRANLRREFLFTKPGNINPYPEVVIDEVTGVLRYSDSKPAKVRGSLLLQPSFETFDYSRTYIQAETWSSLEFLPEMSLTPYDGVPTPSHYDTEVLLQIVFQNDDQGFRRGSFNGKPFQLTREKPILGKLVNGIPIPVDSMPVYTQYGSVVQVIINNPEAGPHPIHLHGHYFWVVGRGQSGDGSYNETLHQLSLSGYKRDTVLVKEKSWLALRFLADNPGVWLMHCHIDWHNLSGMAMVFVEAPELASTIKVPLEAKKVCADHNVFI